MLLRKTYRMPLWMLGAAAVGFLAVPTVGPAQNPAQPQYRPPVQRPASPRQPNGAQPAATPQVAPETIQQTQATAPGAETDVQRELRRLYQESGREMPETPTSISFQRPVPPAPNQAPSNQAAPQQAITESAHTAAASALPQTTPNGQQATAPTTPPPPARTGNPVTNFFKRLAPGNSQNRTAQTRPGQLPPQPNATPALAQQPALSQQPTRPQPASPAPKNYAPYSGYQPQRLPNTTTTAPATAQQLIPAQTAPQGLPPSPSQAPLVQSSAGAVKVTGNPAPAATLAAPPAAPSQPIVQSPPAVTQTTAPPAVTEPEPTFEPPVLLATPAIAAPAVEPAPTRADIAKLLDVPLETTESASQTTDATAAVAPAVEAPISVTATSFPDPFPEMSEEEADDLDETEIESPFVGLKLEAADAVSPPNATPAPTVAIVEPDPLADPQPPVEEPPALIVETPTQPLPVTPAEPPLAIPGTLEIPEAPATPTVAAPETVTVPAAQDQYTERMRQIRDRGGLKGLKGFCPVTLRDERELKDSLPIHYTSFRGQKFHFASAEAKTKFDENPDHYAPAAYGADVVVLVRDKDVAEGSLDFAAWYKGRLYLFANEETYGAFIAEPLKYATPAGLE